MSCRWCFTFYNETFYIPKLQSCGHDFCIRCLNYLYAKDKFVKCPMCRALHYVDPKTLPTALSLIESCSDRRVRMLRQISEELYSKFCEYPNCSEPSYKNGFHTRSLCIKHYNEDHVVLKEFEGEQIHCSINKAKLHVGCTERDISTAKQYKQNVVVSYEDMEDNLDAMVASIQKRKADLVKLKAESLKVLNESLVAMIHHAKTVNTAVTELELTHATDSYEIIKLCKQLMELVRQDKNSLPEQINAIEIRAPWDKIISDLEMSFQSIKLETKSVMISSVVLSNLSLSREYYLKLKEINIIKGEKIPFIWCLDKISEFRESSDPIYSPEFITHAGGYKAQLVIYLNGFGAVKDTHVSLHLRLCKSDSDGELTWPFPWSFMFGIVDQECLSASHYSFIFAFALHGEKFGEYFQQPKSDDNRAFGLHRFMDITTLNANNRFIRDDKLFVAVVLLK